MKQHKKTCPKKRKSFTRDALMGVVKCGTNLVAKYVVPGVAMGTLGYIVELRLKLRKSRLQEKTMP